MRRVVQVIRVKRVHLSTPTAVTTVQVSSTADGRGRSSKAGDMHDRSMR